MNRIKNDNFRLLKREKLKNFLSERRLQKNTQATARKETARRLTSERRARLVSERVQARQRTESLRKTRIKSRVKIRAVKPDKSVFLSSRSKLEKRKIFMGGKTGPGSGEKEAKSFSLASANNQQTKNRQRLLSYLEKHSVKKSEIIAGKIKQKEAADRSEVIPVVIPLVAPPPAPSETVAAVSETVLAPKEETPSPAAEEKPAGRRLKLPLGRGKKISSDTAEPVAVPQEALSARKSFRIVPFLKDHYIKIICLLLVLGWLVEITLLNQRVESVRKQFEQAAGIAKPHLSSEAIIIAKASPPALGTTRMEGIRDPFSNELWRIQEITPESAKTVRSVKIPAPSIIKPITPILIIKPPEFTPPEIARAIPESAKLVSIPQVTVPHVGSVLAPSAPVSSFRFRGILNVAGIDYFFVEGARGGYRVRIGDTVEGFKIYDYRNGVLYFAKDGYTYQLNEERVSPPLRYRGRMIMAGQEYFFLEGQRTYRAVIGEEIESYQLIKRVGDHLYFVKDDRLYYLKQE